MAQDATTTAPVLAIENLSTYFFTRAGLVKAVDAVSLDIRRGETLAIVGESGCGKSVTALSIMQLVPYPPGKIVGGSVKLDGKEMLGLDDAVLRDMRGNRISMIFQEPMTSLNPVQTVGKQVREVLRLHRNLSSRAATRQAIEMLKLVQIPDPVRRAREYPHQMSGGMRQRVMIAMALACEPDLLIADEPTTALDVTIQAQILSLIADLQKKLGTAVLLITHDLGVVAETAQRVVVMYAGRKVEEAAVDQLFTEPLHPYTRGLMGSIPHLPAQGSAAEASEQRLVEIKGTVPALSKLPTGCAFAPRCPLADERCRRESPGFEQHRPNHFAACWHAGEREATS